MRIPRRPVWDVTGPPPHGPPRRPGGRTRRGAGAGLPEPWCLSCQWADMPGCSSHDLGQHVEPGGSRAALGLQGQTCEPGTAQGPAALCGDTGERLLFRLTQILLRLGAAPEGSGRSPPEQRGGLCPAILSRVTSGGAVYACRAPSWGQSRQTPHTSSLLTGGSEGGLPASPQVAVGQTHLLFSWWQSGPSRGGEQRAWRAPRAPLPA